MKSWTLFAARDIAKCAGIALIVALPGRAIVGCGPPEANPTTPDEGWVSTPSTASSAADPAPTTAPAEAPSASAKPPLDLTLPSPTSTPAAPPPAGDE